MSDVAADIIRIVTSIARSIIKHGGTSSHVDATRIELPAFMFDQLELGLRNGYGDQRSNFEAGRGSIQLYGVTLTRGATDAEVRAVAAVRHRATAAKS